MSSKLKNLSTYNDADIPNAKDLKFGIVVSEWNSKITHALYEGCLETLLKHGALENNIEVIQVPGSFELTAGARMLVQRYNSDAIICLGCVITGETKHNEYINMSVAQGLTNLSIASGRPYVFGLLTPENEQQALDRAGGKHGNKGVEAAVTAIRMAYIKKDLGTTKSTIGYS